MSPKSLILLVSEERAAQARLDAAIEAEKAAIAERKAAFDAWLAADKARMTEEIRQKILKEAK